MAQHIPALQGLHSKGFELVSTGGSAAAIEAAGVPVQNVEQLTGFPEMLDGRVKTLHPGVHGGILARRDLPAHMDALSQHGIGAIDIVVVNLYPFRTTVTAQPPPAFTDGVENIDIGGPAMIRAAAKNHAHVAVVVDPADYDTLLQQCGDEGSDGIEFRRHCAWKAFQVRRPCTVTLCCWMQCRYHTQASAASCDCCHSHDGTYVPGAARSS